MGPLTPHAVHGLTLHLSVTLWDSSPRTACGEAAITPCLAKVIEMLYIPTEEIDAWRGLYCGDEWATSTTTHSREAACCDMEVEDAPPSGAGTIVAALAALLHGHAGVSDIPETMRNDCMRTRARFQAYTPRRGAALPTACDRDGASVG
jgi:hypothetical protein